MFGTVGVVIDNERAIVLHFDDVHSLNDDTREENDFVERDYTAADVSQPCSDTELQDAVNIKTECEDNVNYSQDGVELGCDDLRNNNGPTFKDLDSDELMEIIKSGTNNARSLRVVNHENKNNTSQDDNDLSSTGYCTRGKSRQFMGLRNGESSDEPFTLEKWCQGGYGSKQDEQELASRIKPRCFERMLKPKQSIGRDAMPSTLQSDEYYEHQNGLCKATGRRLYTAPKVGWKKKYCMKKRLRDWRQTRCSRLEDRRTSLRTLSHNIEQDLDNTNSDVSEEKQPREAHNTNIVCEAEGDDKFKTKLDKRVEETAVQQTGKVDNSSPPLKCSKNGEVEVGGMTLLRKLLQIDISASSPSQTVNSTTSEKFNSSASEKLSQNSAAQGKCASAGVVNTELNNLTKKKTTMDSSIGDSKDELLSPVSSLIPSSKRKSSMSTLYKLLTQGVKAEPDSEPVSPAASVGDSKHSESTEPARKKNKSLGRSYLSDLLLEPVRSDNNSSQTFNGNGSAYFPLSSEPRTFSDESESASLPRQKAVIRTTLDRRITKQGSTARSSFSHADTSNLCFSTALKSLCSSTSGEASPSGHSSSFAGAEPNFRYSSLLHRLVTSRQDDPTTSSNAMTSLEAELSETLPNTINGLTRVNQTHHRDKSVSMWSGEVGSLSEGLLSFSGTSPVDSPSLLARNGGLKYSRRNTMHTNNLNSMNTFNDMCFASLGDMGLASFNDMGVASAAQFNSGFFNSDNYKSDHSEMFDSDVVVKSEPLDLN